MLVQSRAVSFRRCWVSDLLIVLGGIGRDKPPTNCPVVANGSKLDAYRHCFIHHPMVASIHAMLQRFNADDYGAHAGALFGKE